MEKKSTLLHDPILRNIAHITGISKFSVIAPINKVFDNPPEDQAFIVR